MALFILTLSLFSLHSGVRVSADLMSLDFLWEEGLRIDAECSFDYETIEITIPVRYGKSDDSYLQCIETGAMIGVHPLEGLGLYVEASLLKFGWLWGLSAPSERMAFVSEGSVGWDCSLGAFHISPRVTYRSLLSVSGETAEAMKKIPQFSGVRASILVGVEF